MKGKNIRSLVEATLCHVVKTGDGGFKLRVPNYLYLTFEGIRIVADVTRPPGKRVRALIFKGRAIEPERLYSVAVNSYLTNESGPYKELGRARQTWQSKMGIREMIIQALREKSLFVPRATGNFTVAP